jgi:hypothetical protein
LQEQDLLDSLQLAIARSDPGNTLPNQNDGGTTNPSVFGIGLQFSQLQSDPSDRIIWKRDARMSIYRNLQKAGSEAKLMTDEGLTQLFKHARLNLENLGNPSSAEFSRQRDSGNAFKLHFADR